MKPEPPLGFTVISGIPDAIESYPIDEDFQVVVTFTYWSPHLLRKLHDQKIDEILFGPMQHYTHRDQSPNDMILGSRPYIQSRKNGPVRGF